ncbi:hypothetical protein [Hoeflea sp. BAL378]|uniref:hypothetical protein n=1 Tax=Hoeflea sp. BAL378 TaxID=1547437 RepID=UPI001269C65B|nr:hypothetical protein [Hoeflea sp. BAL378]
MKTHSDNETVDRSRLKLLGVLAAAGASGGCNATEHGRTIVGDHVARTVEAKNPFSTLRGVQSKPLPRTEPAGGEGGGGGGGSH